MSTQEINVIVAELIDGCMTSEMARAYRNEVTSGADMSDETVSARLWNILANEICEKVPGVMLVRCEITKESPSGKRVSCVALKVGDQMFDENGQTSSSKVKSKLTAVLLSSNYSKHPFKGVKYSETNEYPRAPFMQEDGVWGVIKGMCSSLFDAALLAQETAPSASLKVGQTRRI